MSEQMRDGLDLDGIEREELATILRQSQMVGYDDGQGGTLYRSSTVDEIVDAVLAAGFVSPAAVAGRDAENERLRGERQAIDVQHDLLGAELEKWQGMAAQAREDRDLFEQQRDERDAEIARLREVVANTQRDRDARKRQRDAEREAKHQTAEHWRAVVADLRADLDHDRAVLGAVAALADVWDVNAGGESSHANGVRAVLAPVSGAVEGAGEREPTGDEYEAQMARLTVVREFIVERLGEHDAVRNLPDGPTGEMRSVFVEYVDVEGLAAFITDDMPYEMVAPLPVAVHEQEVRADDVRPVDLNAIADHLTDLVDQIGEVGIWGDYGPPAAPVSYVVQTVLDNATAIENRTGPYAEEGEQADEEQSIGNATSLGPCTTICDAGSYGDGPRSACFTPWCKCACHDRAAAARFAARTSGVTE